MKAPKPRSKNTENPRNSQKSVISLLIIHKTLVDTKGTDKIFIKLFSMVSNFPHENVMTYIQNHMNISALNLKFPKKIVITNVEDLMC